MQGLILFRGTNETKCWTLAAWHSPHSLTWRWSLTLRMFKADEGRWWPLLWKHRDNWRLLQWTARIPFVGFLHFSQQRPMWYRDLYFPLREREDQRTGMLWLPDNHPNKIHQPKAKSAPMIVSDGSASLH